MLLVHSKTNCHLTLKMASAQVVETSVTNISASQDSNHPDYLFNQGAKCQSLDISGKQGPIS